MTISLIIEIVHKRFIHLKFKMHHKFVEVLLLLENVLEGSFCVSEFAKKNR